MVNEKPRVLIVDDDQVVCELLCGELEEHGYLCATALSGNDALSKLVTQDFDVVLLDIRLPGISGIEVLREIKLNQCRTAAIMITAVNDLKTAVEAMKLGASDYIVKPFDLDRVNTSIRTLVENQERPSEEGDKQSTKDFLNQMNAIAYGVEAKVDLFTGRSPRVIQRTIDVARYLGIAEEEIQEWVGARVMQDSERRRIIKSLLDKLERSPLTQYMLGMTEPHVYIPKSSELQS